MFVIIRNNLLVLENTFWITKLLALWFSLFVKLVWFFSYSWLSIQWNKVCYECFWRSTIALVKQNDSGLNKYSWWMPQWFIRYERLRGTYEMREFSFIYIPMQCSSDSWTILFSFLCLSLARWPLLKCKWKKLNDYPHLLWMTFAEWLFNAHTLWIRK